MVLLDKLTTSQERDWYAAAPSEHRWSRDVLAHQVEMGLAGRPRHLAAALPHRTLSWASSWSATRTCSTTLCCPSRPRGREFEQALLDRLQQTLLAFGHGTTYVGRQVRFNGDGDGLMLDLLPYNVEQRRYVVIELKIGRFDPAYLGQLGTYVAVGDDGLRRSDRPAPTVGILLCKSRNDTLDRYALGGAPTPLAVAEDTYDSLPPQERGGFPAAAELAAATKPLVPRVGTVDGAVEASRRPPVTGLTQGRVAPDPRRLDRAFERGAAASHRSFGLRDGAVGPLDHAPDEVEGELDVLSRDLLGARRPGVAEPLR